MILHLIKDDKFTDAAYRIFEEVYPCQNVFILVSEQQGLNYIKITPAKIIALDELLNSNFIRSLSKYDMVIVHCMDRIKAKLISKAPKDVSFVWIGMGADYYPLITRGDRQKLLGPLTNELYIENMVLTQGRFIYSIKRVKNKIAHRYGYLARITKRINYFSPVLLEDYNLVSDSFSDFNPKYIPWNYGTLEDDIVRNVENLNESCTNILVGNSSTYENNHIEIFTLLSDLDIDNRKILTPLSYGDPLYRENIIKVGHRLLGANFLPISEFVPIDDYIHRISSCSVVIMNHLRQQAFGNIIVMMYLGAKVFLNRKNPIYDFFKKEGANVFLVDEFIGNASMLNSRLSQTEIEINRSILKKHWSRFAMHIKTKKLIETVLVDKRLNRSSPHVSK